VKDSKSTLKIKGSEFALMLPDELKEKVLNIRIWQRGDERAPHKPLLLLYSLARVSRGEPRRVTYEKAVDDLRKLLKEFGPYRKMHYPSYPFVKLCNDGGFWEIEGNRDLNTTRDWSDRDLIENNTSGGFTTEAYDLLRKDNNLIRELAGLILNQYFPGTLHEDILAQVGLDLDSRVKASFLRDKYHMDFSCLKYEVLKSKQGEFFISTEKVVSFTEIGEKPGVPASKKVELP